MNLDDQATTVPNSVVTTLISTAQSADSSLLNVQLGGAAIDNITSGGGDAPSALLGIVLALVVLFFAFRRSVYGALLPLISALVAIGVGTSIVNVLTHAVSIANWVPEVAVIVALSVGVDYALFVVSQQRNGLLAGQTPEDAAVTALNTSGRAVLLAGVTVCAALLGLLVLPDPSLQGVAVTISLVVVLTMVTSLTLLPAMLGLLGPKVLPRAERKRLAQDGGQVEQPGAFWLRWAEGLGRRPLIPGILALAVIVILRHPGPGLPHQDRGRQRQPGIIDHLPGLPAAGQGVRPRFQRTPGCGRPGQQPRRPGTLRGVRRLGPQPAGRGRDRAASAQPERQGRGRRGVPDHRTTGCPDHHHA